MACPLRQKPNQSSLPFKSPSLPHILSSPILSQGEGWLHKELLYSSSDYLPVHTVEPRRRDVGDRMLASQKGSPRQDSELVHVRKRHLASGSWGHVWYFPRLEQPMEHNQVLRSLMLQIYWFKDPNNDYTLACLLQSSLYLLFLGDYMDTSWRPLQSFPYLGPLDNSDPHPCMWCWLMAG